MIVTGAPNKGKLGQRQNFLSLDIKMDKETPDIISNGVCWKPGQLYFKHSKTFPKIVFCLGTEFQIPKNGDYSALPRN